MDSHSAYAPSLLRDLAQVVSRQAVHTTARLSVSPDFRDGSGSGVASGESPSGDFELMGRVYRAVQAGGGADEHHAAGLIALIWADSSDGSVNGAISSLVAASRLSPPSAALLADLSAAYLIRAERTGTARDLLQALEKAEQALAREPGNRAALFNRALAMDWLALDGEAARAWKEFIRVEPGSGWAGEARRRLRALSAPTGVPRPGGGASAEAFAAYARRAPQEARVIVMDSLLGEWGDAVLGGDSVRAGDLLHAAGAVGQALERRGGDGTVAALVRATRAQAGNPVATQSLARAHVAYARAAAELDIRRADSAGVHFETARRLGSASPVLRLWAEYSRGVALFYAGQSRIAEPVFQQLTMSVDGGRYPVLAGRVRWSMGTLMLRNGAYEKAQAMFAEAAAFFERAGERENLGAVQALEAEALSSLGNEDSTYAVMARALRTLRPYRASVRLHNLLYVAAQAATALGLVRAALCLYDEDVTVAMRLRPAVRAEALLARARALAAAGDFAGAASDVEASRVLVDSLPRGFERSWYEEDIKFAAAGLDVRKPSAQVIANLDSAVAFFARTSTLKLFPMLVQRAEVRLASGDAEGAVADLSTAAATLESLSKDVRSAASMLEAERVVFDRLVMLYARRGRPNRALMALERGRASLSPISRSRRGIVSLIEAPPGEVALVYSLIGDTLLTFTVEGARVRLDSRVVDRSQVLQAVDHARSMLELRAPVDSVRSDLAFLYDELVRRVPLRAGAPLVLVTDGEIAGVPFAALQDTVSKRYLIEDHRLRFLSTLRDAQWQSPIRGALVGRALFVADPAFDRGLHPGLQPLRETAASIRTIAAGYPGAVVLTGAAATRDALRSELGRASIFHFAGHAVFDDQRPDHSYLVLASGQGNSDALAASDIERMNLANVRLVVLSACQTQRAVGGRSGGFAGLSGAMLAAGAGGVVGSLWRVNDRLTRDLMSEFHRAYRTSGDGADALRQAQLRLLRSGDPSRSSPAAWAGFRYAGS